MRTKSGRYLIFVQETPGGETKQALLTASTQDAAERLVKLYKSHDWMAWWEVDAWADTGRPISKSAVRR